MLDFHQNKKMNFYFYTLISMNWLKTTVEQVNNEL